MPEQQNLTRDLTDQAVLEAFILSCAGVPKLLSLLVFAALVFSVSRLLSYAQTTRRPHIAKLNPQNYMVDFEPALYFWIL